MKVNQRFTTFYWRICCVVLTVILFVQSNSVYHIFTRTLPYYGGWFGDWAFITIIHPITISPTAILLVLQQIPVKSSKHRWVQSLHKKSTRKTRRVYLAVYITVYVSYFNNYFRLLPLHTDEITAGYPKPSWLLVEECGANAP